jgi:hypothetical protein
MKNSILFFLLIISLQACAQENKKTISAATPVNTDTIICDSIIQSLRYYSGFPIDDSIMDVVIQKWESENFYALLKKYKISKISCAGCTGVSAEIQFRIDNEGKFHPIKLVRGYKCGEYFDDAFTKDLFQSFSKIIFPKELRNKCFERNVGRALKC